MGTLTSINDGVAGIVDADMVGQADDIFRNHSCAVMVVGD